jgi:hypothetical protein
MKPRTEERADDRTEIKSPSNLFHLARLLEGGLNPLTLLLTGGVLDLASEPLPEEGVSQERYTAVIVKGLLESNQIIRVPNLTKWWWLQNGTSGPFSLKMQTPFGAVSTAIPQNRQWQLIRRDGNNNIIVSRQHKLPEQNGAREWAGPEREGVLTKMLDLARVPMDRRSSELRYAVNSAIERALLVYRIRKLNRRKDIRVRLRNIAKLTRDLLEALDEIDDEVFRVCHVDRVSVVGLLATLLDVPLRSFAKSQPKKKVAHRPRGSIQNPILRMLILDLYRSVVEQGRGKLTLRRDVDDIKGTLPAVLAILRPFLPKVIPVKIPYKTLRNARKSAGQARSQALRIRD